MSFYHQDLKKVIKEIKKEVNKSLKDNISEQVVDALANSVRKNVYENYTPKEYQRTYELFSSIMSHYKVKDKNNVEFGAIFDDSMTHESYYGSSRLGIDAGEDVAMGHIAQWMNDNKNMFRNVDSNFMNDVEKELLKGSDPVIMKMLRKDLKSKGIILIKR